MPIVHSHVGLMFRVSYNVACVDTIHYYTVHSAKISYWRKNEDFVEGNKNYLQELCDTLCKVLVALDVQLQLIEFRWQCRRPSTLVTAREQWNQVNRLHYKTEYVCLIPISIQAILIKIMCLGMILHLIEKTLPSPPINHSPCSINLTTRLQPLQECYINGC